jgi:hypothetical protein
MPGLYKRRRETKDWLTRYEAKYVVPEALCTEIRTFIKPFCKVDSHAAGNPPQYTITTLQLDTPDYALHHAKEFEAVNRFKLRVRTYGSIGSSPVFPEVKAKLENTIIKNRVAIAFEQWSPQCVYALELPESLNSGRQIHDFLQFRRLVWETQAKPVALIRYRRESYVGETDHYARVTMDRKLEYQMTASWDDFGRSGRWRSMDSTEAQGFGLSYSGVILELKTLAHVPIWIQEMVERFELKKCGNCKYSTAIWREGGFRGYPEAGDFAEEILGAI